MNEFVAQQQMQELIGDEIARRVKIHQQEIARATARRERVGVEAPPPQLELLAMGDSWFDYPLNGNVPAERTDIIVHLKRMGTPRPIILNISHWGYATTQLMAWPKQKELIDQLQDPRNWTRGKPDAILFSGGGNDVAGDQFSIFLDEAPAPLNRVRFSKILVMLEASYGKLFSLRDRYARGVPIFGHCYDFAIPDGQGVICSGPWLFPSLNYSRYTVEQGTPIVREALLEFKRKLLDFQNEARNHFFMVDTQGTLRSPDYKEDWANELHPYSEGFEALAERFLAALRSNFRNKI
jgi:hypothetical protein